MAIIDFKEISKSNLGDGEQDTFELFAREFLKDLGFKVISNPSRGPDGGKDLIVREVRSGIGGESQVNWLVSCKHYAHSGSSIGVDIEKDINDRLATHRCQGFLAFYSTLPSTGLMTKLEGLGKEFLVYDRESIERELLGSSEGVALAKRFFPSSIEKWKAENPAPAKIFLENPVLNCENCKKNLLDKKYSYQGIIVFLHRMPDDASKAGVVEDIYCSCKGNCDKKLRSLRKRKDLADGWEDISDLTIPAVYIKWIVGIMNDLWAGEQFSEKAFGKLKDYLLNIYPFVSRNFTEDEKSRIKSLIEIPDYLGGMGHD